MQLSENTIAGKLAFAFLCLFAAGLAFSISIAQTGLGLTFLIFIATLSARRGRATLEITGARTLKLFYAGAFLWVLWRIYHIFVSTVPIAELIEAREVWLMLIPAFIWFYASSRKRLYILVTCFIAGAAVSSAYGAWQMRDDFLNWVRGRGMSSMHHLNFAGLSALASMLGLGLSLSLYYAGKKWKATLMFFMTFSVITGLWLTKSRASIAAFAILIPFFIYVQLFHRAHRAIFVGMVVIFTAIIIPRIPESIAEQYRFPPANVHAGSQAERRDLWQAGLAMIQERPLTGFGERDYNLAYPRFQVAGAMGVAEYDKKDRSASHMHNDFINTWVLYGLIGLLIQLFYYFVGGFIYLRERFRLSRASDRPLAAAGATTLLLMALMGITQCHFTSEIVQMSFWLCVGTLIAILDSDRLGVA
jgi:O-antigen ligase